MSFTWPGHSIHKSQYFHFVWTQCAGDFGIIETETLGASTVGYCTLTISCEDDAALCVEAILWYKHGVTFCHLFFPRTKYVYIYVADILVANGKARH